MTPVKQRNRHDPANGVWGDCERALTRTEQVMLCGNSVNPQVAEALVRANLGAARAEVA